MKKTRILHVITICSCMFFFFCLTCANATPYKAPEKIKAVMVGDRLVDVALKLGVVAEGMSVRASMWPKACEIRVASQLLGCPNCIVTKRPDTVASFMKERGITRLILEKNPRFCLYMKDVNPQNVANLVKDVPGVIIEYVDFSKGMAVAIKETAALFGKEEKGREIAAAYDLDMKKVEASLPKQELGKRVLVLNGNYSIGSGKLFVRIEAPGGYTDQYILNPLGCKNASENMLSDTMKISKGHFPGGRLSNLANANPDVIVATGNGFAVQLALYRAMKNNPALADIPAIKNGAIYNLPFYGDSSVLEYPQIFQQWQMALED